MILNITRNKLVHDSFLTFHQIRENQIPQTIWCVYSQARIQYYSERFQYVHQVSGKDISFS